jgi:hypothetical protein
LVSTALDGSRGAVSDNGAFHTLLAAKSRGAAGGGTMPPGPLGTVEGAGTIEGAVTAAPGDGGALAPPDGGAGPALVGEGRTSGDGGATGAELRVGVTTARRSRTITAFSATKGPSIPTDLAPTESFAVRRWADTVTRTDDRRASRERLRERRFEARRVRTPARLRVTDT